jgi:hypothetical protein
MDHSFGRPKVGDRRPYNTVPCFHLRAQVDCESHSFSRRHLPEPSKLEPHNLHRFYPYENGNSFAAICAACLTPA